jgi:non-specific serine/threonine protein kinase
LVTVVAGPWLAKTLAGLRDPSQLAHVDPGTALKATLRPYQQVGVRWLHLLSSLGLGACLADDMGLGKTMQVLALLLVMRGAQEIRRTRRTSLLVAPASLLANWAAEIERFAPTLTAIIAHPSAMSGEELKTFDRDRIAGVDLVITSYGSLLRVPALLATPWRLAILDEAQAIKTPGAKQTRAAKQIDARARIALSGTPVENRLGDLWSIFDFLNPGLLGSGKGVLDLRQTALVADLQLVRTAARAVRPYILRRLKTDTSVISDLPDKTEVKAFCQLTRKQAALYQQSVADLSTELERADGMQRRGVVLASLMRLKQICNHPSQWPGRRLVERGRQRQVRPGCARSRTSSRRGRRKVLVVHAVPRNGRAAGRLSRVRLRAPGRCPCTAKTAVGKRTTAGAAVPGGRARALLRHLAEGPAGAGLNLTAASHVVHFDRWWNPAVENQATDRAFRIGQTRNVWCTSSSAAAPWKNGSTTH